MPYEHTFAQSPKNPSNYFLYEDIFSSKLCRPYLKDSAPLCSPASSPPIATTTTLAAAQSSRIPPGSSTGRIGRNLRLACSPFRPLPSSQRFSQRSRLHSPGVAHSGFGGPVPPPHGGPIVRGSPGFLSPHRRRSGEKWPGTAGSGL